MAHRIEDYAMIGDLHTVALIGKGGSLDWLCLPRFDSPACFASLVGDEDNGRWLIAPDEEVQEIRRRYRDDTLILETEFRTAQGTVAIIDFMPHAGDSDRTDVIRLVEGRTGEVAMHTELILRFDYGKVIPWVRHEKGGLRAIAGPTALRIRSPVSLRGKNFRSVSKFRVAAGQTVPFVLTCYPSHKSEPGPIDSAGELKETERWWREWSARYTDKGPWREPVMRSLITLKALTYKPTGGIVAAPTTSLPEALGGARNWDYRYCWVRDASFTLYALLISGYHEEARAWREWLLRAVAGSAEQLQTLYGVAGERWLKEYEVPWLKGYENSPPVRVGNEASGQFQLDVYGELMDAFHVARAHHVKSINDAWALQQKLIEFLESNWDKPDEGIWEVRGGRRHFTYSKVMAWVAMDRAVKAIERFNLNGSLDRWSALRDRIHAEVCQRGFNQTRNTFVQYYGAEALDSSLLLMPLVGFLPANDPRVVSTVEAIRQTLMSDGLVRRYETEGGVDGLKGREGAFLACTFWLADNLAMIGRRKEAQSIFERLLDLRNDVGLLAEEYDPQAKRLVGNFPQAFSHIALVNTAYNLNLPQGKSA